MKKALLALCLVIGLCLFAVAFWPTQTVRFDAIPVVSDAEIEALIESRTVLPFDAFSVNACGSALPYDKTTNTRYAPKITEDISLDFPFPWRIVRTDMRKTAAEQTVCRLLFYTHTVYTVCTLIETSLPIINVQLQQFDLDAQYLTSERTLANAAILSADENGCLQQQTNRVEIKTRGGSSTNYPKKSYTLFFLDTSGRPGLHSPLGLPADRKFALNSLYEDESKIRDAFAHRLWETIEPQHALQFVYAELVLNNTYYGLYGFHQIITENALHTTPDDTVFKIETGLETDPATYRAEQLPGYEIAVPGNTSEHALLQTFFETLVPPIQAFPQSIDEQNFANYTVLMEIIAARDATLKNMVLTHRDSTNRFYLTPWDMDQSFGLTWDITAKRHSRTSLDYTQMRYTDPLYEGHIEPIHILYAACPSFQESVAARYRELRETVFTDEALLEQAAALYDMLTNSGARARDAARWPNSAVSEDNGFIEAFLPTRMAFLDGEFSLPKEKFQHGCADIAITGRKESA